MSTQTITCHTLGEKIDQERSLRAVGWPFTTKGDEDNNCWIIEFQRPF